MARTAGTFGTIEELKSGQWRARYRHQGKRWTAPEPFASEDLARGYLSVVKYSIAAGSWLPPEKSDPARPELPRPVPTFKDYAESWIERRLTGEVGNRRPMRDTTANDYRHLLSRAVYPTFGKLPLDGVDSDDVAGWYRRRVKLKKPTDTANAYSLMRTIFAAAIEDGHIAVTPCRVGGAATTKKRKRKPVTLTPQQVDEVAAGAGERYRLAVLLGAWCTLRSAEVRGLRRRSIDTKAWTVTVDETAIPVKGEGTRSQDDAKTAAGIRTVAIPPHIAGDVAKHLERIPNVPDALLFPAVGDPSQPVAASTLYRHWNRARKAAGFPTARFHDCRHTGATLAARAGATLAELQNRLGHTTVNAAMIYQHADRERDRSLADAISVMVSSKSE